MTIVKDAVGYVRCSTDLQEDSPEQQKKEISAFAEMHGYTVKDWYVDFGKSGTSFDPRPAFQQLRKAVDNRPKFSVVIAYDESRWGRAIDAEENTFWRVYFRKKGVEVLLVKTSVDPKNEFAPMLKAFEGVQASQYSKKLSELTLRGTKANGVFSNGGFAPYGYKRIAVNSKTGVERELADGDWCVKGQEKVRWALGSPQEVEVVRLIFRERINRKAYVLIADKLNKQGVPCARRGRWRAKDQKWSGATVKAILENQAYYGARVYNRNSMSKILAHLNGRLISPDVTYPHFRNDRDQWIIQEDAHPPILSKETWLQANQVARQSAARKSNQHVVRSPYLLGGLMICSKCGFRFQGQGSSAKSRNYSRYVDGGWANKRVCTFLALPKDALERLVINLVKDTLREPEVIASIEHHLGHLMQEESRKGGQGMDLLRSKLRENKHRQRNLIEAIEHKGTAGSLSILLQRLEEVEQEARELDRQILEVRDAAAKRMDIQSKADLIKTFISEFEEVFDSAPMDEKKLMLRKCISGITVDRDRGVARIVIRRLPAVTQEIEELMYTKTAPTSQVVGAASSGDRT